VREDEPLLNVVMHRDGCSATRQLCIQTSTLIQGCNELLGYFEAITKKLNYVLTLEPRVSNNELRQGIAYKV
jgi:hypothetical protein